MAAMVGSLGFFSAGSSLPAWHQVIVGLALVPAVLLFAVELRQRLS